jgi:iron complex transport system ATP-binding protein
VELFELACALVREARKAVVAVSHDINLASQHCHRLVLLKEGKAQYCGTPAEVVKPEALEDAYGVRALVDSNPVSGTPRVTLQGLRETTL